MLGRVFIWVSFTTILQSCQQKVAYSEFCGAWINSDENCTINLNCDSTFALQNLPSDVDNCFFEYPGKDIQGKWQIEEDKRIKLKFGKSSYCIIELVNNGNKTLRMRTKSDSDLIIDFHMQHR